ncbi:hypothetical protein EYF80_038107 [Liparis tanakae]|uniref:Uncharacterized protein n=1 Tax=Liparis tanakae TaxID=230148 RepID=A0A4Z2GEU8_9TELE|nr:hypothetical protein EYF80_038107 [Liparis tanakae]
MGLKTPAHSPRGGAGALTGATLALLLGQSLGDLLLAALDGMGVGRSSRPELRPELRPGPGPGPAPAPAPAPVAPYKGSVADWVLRRAAGCPASGAPSVSPLNGLVGSLENSPKASEEKSK